MEDIKARKAHEIGARTPEEARRLIAESAASAELAAARAVQAIEGNKGLGKYLDTPELIRCLREQAVAVNQGDLSEPEAMLMNQATVLQSLFARLTERGMGCDHSLAFEANMRVALRAQSQCRATLETLAAIRNPPVVFAKQANIAAGPQQVNNSVEPSRARENESQQNKLSGERHELLPDARASALTLGVNQTMEAVGAVNGTAVEGRQGEGSEER